MKDKKPKNPLRTLWNTLGTVGGIISLSSMVQNWAGDLVKWKGFFLTIIDSYRQVVRPFFEFMTQWLPFDFPFWMQDYLVFGLIVAASELRATKIRKKQDYLSLVPKAILWPVVLAEYPRRPLSQDSCVCRSNAGQSAGAV